MHSSHVFEFEQILVLLKIINFIKLLNWFLSWKYEYVQIICQTILIYLNLLESLRFCK